MDHSSNLTGEHNALAKWIKKFEDDSYRFSNFLISQILLLKPDIGRITDQNNIEKFKQHLKALLFTYTQENYTLIKRHYILLHLLSDLALELSSENYSNVQNILNAFKKDKIKKITRLINNTYNELIVEFSNLDIGSISTTDAAKLDALIKNSLKGNN